MSIWTVGAVVAGAIIGTGIVIWLDIIIHAIIGIFKETRCGKQSFRRKKK